MTKLDRFAHDTQDALNTIKLLFEKGVRINVLNLGIIENTSTGRLILRFSAFADFERDLIVERTQEGKELAKLSKPIFVKGAPKFNQQQITLAHESIEESFL